MNLLLSGSYRDRQRFLYNDEYPLVHRYEWVSESYSKILVTAAGDVTCNFTMPALLWLGVHHRCAQFNLRDVALLLLHNDDASQPLNAWWEQLRVAKPELPVLRGDLIFARKHAPLQWDAAAFAAHTMKF